MCEVLILLKDVKTLLVERKGLPKWKPDSMENMEELQIQKYFKAPPDWTNPLRDL